MGRRVIAAGRSCLECRRRKIKCDRSLPCDYCVRNEIQCQYPPNPSSRASGPSRVSDSASKNSTMARLDKMESSLRSMQQQFREVKQSVTPPQIGHKQLSGALSDSHSLNSNPTTPSLEDTLQGTRTALSLPFMEQGSLQRTQLHPPATVISELWQTYLDIVDPILKIFHVPTVQKYISAAINDPSSLESPATSLLCATYYATVMALPPSECQKKFEEDRHTLIQRYRTGVNAALSKANILTSQDLTVLQSLVLYITCGRRDEQGPDVCTLIALAVGMGMRMGLHCKDSVPGVSPFEVEMRRRLWWHIGTLDVRIVEDYHVAPSIPDSICDTPFPSNVSDANLHPDMSEPPQSQQARTEMLYCLVRFHTSHLARQVVFSDDVCRKLGYSVLPVAEKCDLIDESWNHLEETLLSWCDMNVPLDYVTATSVRLVMVKLKLFICKPQPNEQQYIPGRTQYRQTCEEVLNLAHALRKYEKGRQWLWLFQTYIEWDALAYLLLELCLVPSDESARSTWATIEDIYHYWNDCPDIRRDQRWPHIEELRHAALSKRGRVSTTTTQSLPQAPLTPSGPTGSTGRSDGSSTMTLPARMITGPQFQLPATSTTAVVGYSAPAPVSHASMANVVADKMNILWTHANDVSILGDNLSLEELPQSISSYSVDPTWEWNASLFEKYWEVAG